VAVSCRADVWGSRPDHKLIASCRLQATALRLAAVSCRADVWGSRPDHKLIASCRLQATALRLAALEEEGSVRGASLGRLLRLIEQQARKTCDSDVGGCGAWNPVSHFLDRAPRVFTLQLAWESQREESADIAATLAAVEDSVSASFSMIRLCSPALCLLCR
jgi:hypothetical protein